MEADSVAVNIIAPVIDDVHDESLFPAMYTREGDPDAVANLKRRP